jgi:hypothetical protein
MVLTHVTLAITIRRNNMWRGYYPQYAWVDDIENKTDRDWFGPSADPVYKRVPSSSSSSTPSSTSNLQQVFFLCVVFFWGGGGCFIFFFIFFFLIFLFFFLLLMF